MQTTLEKKKEFVIKEIDPDYTRCDCCDAQILKSESKILDGSKFCVCINAATCVENMEEHESRGVD